MVFTGGEGGSDGFNSYRMFIMCNLRFVNFPYLITSTRPLQVIVLRVVCKRKSSVFGGIKSITMYTGKALFLMEEGVNDQDVLKLID